MLSMIVLKKYLQIFFIMAALSMSGRTMQSSPHNSEENTMISFIRNTGETVCELCRLLVYGFEFGDILPDLSGLNGKPLLPADVEVDDYQN